MKPWLRQSIFLLLAAIAGMAGTFYAMKHAYRFGFSTTKESEAGAVQGANPAASSSNQAASDQHAVYRCPMHPWIIRDEAGTCPICGMDLVAMQGHANASPDQSSPGAIRIDPVMVQNMGVRLEPIQKRKLIKEVRTTGKVAVDETRQFSVNAKVMGWAEKLNADFLGKPVRKGESLMEVYSPDLIATQEEFLQALRFANTGVHAPGSEAHHQAGNLLASARRRLEFWDIPAAAIDRLEKTGAATRTMPIAAPASGVITLKNVVEGQSFMAGAELFRIADLSKVWVLGQVYQSDLEYLAKGQSAEVRLAYLPNQVFTGKVTFLSPVMDPESKTAELRIELPNDAEFHLRPEMVADVRIHRDLGEGLAIPEQAILHTGKRDIAVVSTGGGFFEPREVRLGAVAEGYAEVRSGLQEGEMLVTSAQFLIDSESNLRAAVMRMGRSGTEAAQGDKATPSPTEAPAQPVDHSGHQGH
jgi:membrane fusion protein, copper/silver efflux system